MLFSHLYIYMKPTYVSRYNNHHYKLAVCALASPQKIFVVSLKPLSSVVQPSCRLSQTRLLSLFSLRCWKQNIRCAPSTRKQNEVFALFIVAKSRRQN